MPLGDQGLYDSRFRLASTSANREFVIPNAWTPTLTLERCVHLFRRNRNRAERLVEGGVVDEIVAFGAEDAPRFRVNACGVEYQYNGLPETWHS